MKNFIILGLGLILILLNGNIIFGQDIDDQFLENEDDIPTIEGTGDPIKIVEEADVLVLNKDNFHHIIGSKKLILVEFYAPWCGHCKSLEPEYASAASKLKDDGIRIAKVDATVDENLAKEYGITGFPTLKLFKDGDFFEDFEGERTSTGIIEYMKKHADPNYKPPPSLVKVLEESNFANFIQAKVSLVEFYAPWCGHCKKLAPEYEGAALDLEKEKIFLGKVDATVEKELAKKHDVTGYPRLFVFREGKSYEYKGPRTRDGIVDYMKKQAQLPSEEILSPSTAKNRLSRTEPCVFAYFESHNGMFNQYIAALNHMRDEGIFLHTFDSTIASKYKLDKNSVNIIFPEIYQSKFEEKIVSYKELSGESVSILSWIRSHIVPLVGHRTRSNVVSKYSKRPLVVVYYDVNFSHQYMKATQIVRNKILPVAAKFANKLAFAISSEEEFDDDLKNVGLDDSGEDVNVAIYGDKGLRYAMEPEDDFDSEVLEEFVSKFLSNKLRPFFKSQAVPKRQEGPVRIVVAKTFEKDVLMSDKNVLIELYAPWCGHCKQLEPHYKKLAKYFLKENPDVVIAKMDATANDVHPFLPVEGFPTIYLVKAFDKEKPVQFSGGDRSFDALRDFVKAEISPKKSKEEL